MAEIKIGTVLNRRRFLQIGAGSVLALGAAALVQGSNALIAGSAAPAMSTTTGVVPYQGRLADAAGTPLTGIYPMIFRLYNSAGAGATPLWEEQWTGPNSVKVRDGLFNVMLGSLTPIPQDVVTGNNTLWLGITVGTDDEMTPRVQLGSVLFAVQANTVPDDSITTEKIANNTIQAEDLSPDAVPPGVPVGSVISWWRPDAGTLLPSDRWAIADGSVVADPESPLYGKTLPNLTDRFIMGVTAENIGAMGGSNTLNLSHSHTVNDHTHSIPQHAHGSGSLQAQVGIEDNRVYMKQYGPGFNATIANYTNNTHANSHACDTGADVEGSTDGWSGWTGGGQPGTNGQLSSATDNRPQYVGLIFLVRIK
jgi:hypothetical protein